MDYDLSQYFSELHKHETNLRKSFLSSSVQKALEKTSQSPMQDWNFSCDLPCDQMEKMYFWISFRLAKRLMRLHWGYTIAVETGFFGDVCGWKKKTKKNFFRFIATKKNGKKILVAYFPLNFFSNNNFWRRGKKNLVAYFPLIFFSKSHNFFFAGLKKIFSRLFPDFFAGQKNLVSDFFQTLSSSFPRCCCRLFQTFPEFLQTFSRFFPDFF